jgi:hypothetical protein
MNQTQNQNFKAEEPTTAQPTTQTMNNQYENQFKPEVEPTPTAPTMNQNFKPGEPTTAQSTTQTMNNQYENQYKPEVEPTTAPTMPNQYENQNKPERPTSTAPTMPNHNENQFPAFRDQAQNGNTDENQNKPEVEDLTTAHKVVDAAQPTTVDTTKNGTGYDPYAYQETNPPERKEYDTAWPLPNPVSDDAKPTPPSNTTWPEPPNYDAPHTRKVSAQDEFKKVGDVFVDAKEGISRSVGNTYDTVEHGLHDIKESITHMPVRETFHDVKEGLKEVGSDMKEQAIEAKEQISESITRNFSSAKT